MSEETSPEVVLRRVNKLRNAIEEAKSERDQKVGERSGILKDLKDRFRINDLDGAKQQIHTLDISITRRNKKIDTTYSELKEKYDF